jgi:hypothetical protein
VPGSSLNQTANANVMRPEQGGGIYLDALPEGMVLEVETSHHHYTIVNRAHGEALISGHPKFCPEPIVVRVEGSTWGGCMLKVGFIGLGMRLTFQLPTHRTVTTSPVLQIRARQPLPR